MLPRLKDIRRSVLDFYACRHWRTGMCNVQVCQRTDDHGLMNCIQMRTPSPGPETVTLEPSNDCTEVIFVTNSSFEIFSHISPINDIRVEYLPIFCKVYVLYILGF